MNAAAKALDRLKLAADVIKNGPINERLTQPPLQPVGDPWTVNEYAETRQAAAMTLLDPDITGFALVLFRRQPIGIACCVEVSHVLPKDYWPYVEEAVHRGRPVQA